MLSFIGQIVEKSDGQVLDLPFREEKEDTRYLSMSDIFGLVFNLIPFHSIDKAAIYNISIQSITVSFYTIPLSFPLSLPTPSLPTAYLPSLPFHQKANPHPSSL